MINKLFKTNLRKMKSGMQNQEKTNMIPATSKNKFKLHSWILKAINVLIIVSMLLPNVYGTAQAFQADSDQIWYESENVVIKQSVPERLDVERLNRILADGTIYDLQSHCPIGDGYCFKSDDGYFSVHSQLYTYTPDRALFSGTWEDEIAQGEFTNVHPPDGTYGWVIFDLGEVFEITKFLSYDYHDGAPVQVSLSTDAVNWTHIEDFTSYWHENGPSENTYYNDPSNPILARYVRYYTHEGWWIGDNIRLHWFSFLSNTASGLHPPVPETAILSSSSLLDCDMGSTAACVTGQAADPVNTLTGAFEYSKTDLSIPTMAGSLTLNLSYSSLALDSEINLYDPLAGDTSLGYGWTHNHDISLSFNTTPDPDEVVFKGPSANQYTFFDNGDGTYTPFPGITATLTYNSGSSRYMLEDAGHNLYEFDNTGKLLSLTNDTGFTFTYSYDGNGFLDRVTAPDGIRYLEFDYDAQDRISTVSDHASRSVSFTYDVDNNIETYTDTSGMIWYFGYDALHQMETVQVEDPADPGVYVTRTRNLYDSQGRVVCQQEGDQHPPVTSYQLVSGQNVCKQSDGSEAIATSITYVTTQDYTIIKDPNGNISTDYYSGSRNLLADEEDALGNMVSRTMDENFRPVSVTDAEGNFTELAWSADGYNLTQITDAEENITQLGYDSLNNLTSVTDPDENETHYYYEDSNYPTRITRQEVSNDGGTTWLTTTYTYYGPADTAPGKLKQVTSPKGNSTFFTYDQYGQVLSITSAYGELESKTTSFAYDNLGRQVEIVNPAGVISRSEYDSAGRLVRSIQNCKENYPTDCMSSYPQNYEENGEIFNIAVSYTYDFQGNMIAVTDTEGVITRNYYDSQNRAVTVVRNLVGQSINTSTPPVRGSGAVDENIRTAYTYDSTGNMVAVIDPLGIITRIYYDDADRSVKTVYNLTGSVYNAAPPAYDPQYPDQNVFTDTEYDKNGNVIATTDVNGVTTRTYYDALNRPATVVQNLIGQAISVTTPPARNTANVSENVRSDTYYDDRGNLIATVDPMGNITRTYYDTLNRPVTVVQNLTGQTINEPTPPARGSVADENIRMDTTYDENGNVLTTTDSQSLVTKYAYNDLGQLTSVTINFLDGQPQNYQNEYNIVTSYAYDSLGNRISVTDTVGMVTYFEYDQLGRTTAEIQNYVDGGPVDSQTNLRTEYSYDASGNRITETGPDGIVTKFEYDSLGRMTAVVQNYVDGGPVDHQTNLRTEYAYDEGGNRVTLTDANYHTTSYAYDGLGRTITETDANNHSMTSEYDGIGNLLAQIDGNNHTTTFGYDNLYRMTSVTNALSKTTQYGFDVLGNMVSMTDANNVVTAYEYDGMGRLSAVVENYIDGATPDHETNVRTEYDYDMGGNLTTILDGNNHTSTFGYDSLNRLTSESDALNHTTSYTFDQAGNMVLKTDANGQDITYSYDDLNRLTGIDYDGDQINDVTYTYEETGQVDYMIDSMGTTDWTYDPLGRVTSVIDPFYSTVSYGYDAVGNRTSLIYPGTETVTYTYDPANRLEDVTDWNLQTTSYTYDDANRLTSMNLPNGVNAGYTYDTANQITNISYTKDENVLAQYAYNYDNAGNRVEMQEFVQLSGQFMPVVEVTVKNSLDQPVVGITVEALDDETPTGITAVTDSEGIARISLPAGNFRFHVLRSGTDFYSGETNHCLTPACTDARITIFMIDGSVVDDLGSPAPGIEVAVYDDTGDAGLRGITDANGQVQMVVPDGCYRLYSAVEGQQAFSNRDCTAIDHAAALSLDLADALSTTVTIKDDIGTLQENVTIYAFAGEVYTGFTGVSDVNGEVTLALPMDDYRYAPDLPSGGTPSDVQITVTVQDTSAVPQAGLTVYALSGTEYNEYKTFTGRSVETDVNGQAVFTLPQVGQYRFRVENGSLSTYSELTPLCDPQTCSAVTVTIPGTGGDVVVTALDETGQPVAETMIYAFDEETYTGLFAETDVNGEATLSLPEGDYRFAMDVNGETIFSDTVNHCSLPGCTTAQVSMTPLNAVTVSVQDGAAEPVQDKVVYVFEGLTYAEMSYTGISGKSDELGEITFTLPDGNYWFAYEQDQVAVNAGEAAVCALPGCTSSILSTNQGITTSYVYDPLNRLTEAAEVGTETTTYGYTWDAVGNRLTSTVNETTVNYSYDIANRLTAVDGITYTWDNNGNLLSDGVYTYSYDLENRLTGVTDGVDNHVYAYNASGDRLQQTLNNVPTNYTLDLIAPYTQVLADGTNTYLYGLVRIAQQDMSNMLYFIPDALGSVRQLVDGTGNVVHTNTYDPFGNVVNSSGTESSPYGFTGEYTDFNGLIYLRARFYDPFTGRFTSRDTWEGDYQNPLTINYWNYVNGNPILYTDPSGNYLTEEDAQFDGKDYNSNQDSILHPNEINNDYSSIFSFYFLPIEESKIHGVQWFGKTRRAYDLDSTSDIYAYCYGGQHCGLDLLADYGTPVRAGLYGRIQSICSKNTYKCDFEGPYAVVIQVGYFYIKYGHLDGNTPNSLRVGQYVTPYTFLGGVGNMGGFEGSNEIDHIHLEIRGPGASWYGGDSQNPLQFMNTDQINSLIDIADFQTIERRMGRFYDGHREYVFIEDLTIQPNSIHRCFTDAPWEKLNQ